MRPQRPCQLGFSRRCLALPKLSPAVPLTQRLSARAGRAEQREREEARAGDDATSEGPRFGSKRPGAFSFRV
jgi:hypothetical protein